MKRSYLLALFLFSGIAAGAQSFGSSHLTINGEYDINQFVFGVWLKQGKSNAAMRFNQTPEGLGSALKTVQKLLSENQKSYDSPDLYSSYEGTDLGKKTPLAMHNSIQAGNSKINEGWIAPDGSILQLVLGSCNYEVCIINAYKQEK